MSAEAPSNNQNHIGSPKLTQQTSGGVELPFHSNNENLGQSPPPHSYRHSRAYRHFKNPPQPHMCIRVATHSGEEVFINVLSWTRILMPQDPADPIPLYGGMKVPPGSPRCPPLVYAVMANPEVLKYSGRHCKDPEERRAMIELMCEFVQAMNPDLRLTRNAVILKDRDISGELKDVWNAVQAQRDREREVQVPIQQQCAAPPPQQIFLPQSQQEQMQQFAMQSHNFQQQHQQQLEYMHKTMQENQNYITESGVENIRNGQDISVQQTEDGAFQLEQNTIVINDSQASIVQSAINSANYNTTNVNDKDNSPETDSNDGNIPISSSDATDSKLGNNSDKDSCVISNSANNDKVQTNVDNDQVSTSTTAAVSKQTTTASGQPTITNTSSMATVANASAIVTSTTVTSSAPISQSNVTTVTIPTPAPAPVLTTKKEKLGGFLPNGCHNIFPRFKNNKHKDKDKEKDKDKDVAKSSSGKDKEKTLLNSFKRSSSAATNASNKTQQQQQNEDTKTTQYEKNCINLEAEVEKLDLNKIDTPSNDVLIKLKVASSGAK